MRFAGSPAGTDLRSIVADIESQGPMLGGQRWKRPRPGLLLAQDVARFGLHDALLVHSEHDPSLATSGRLLDEAERVWRALAPHRLLVTRVQDTTHHTWLLLRFCNALVGVVGRHCYPLPPIIPGMEAAVRPKPSAFGGRRCADESRGPLPYVSNANDRR